MAGGLEEKFEWAQVSFCVCKAQSETPLTHSRAEESPSQVTARPFLVPSLKPTHSPDTDVTGDSNEPTHRPL